jgi:succinyl-diaminopimelate desuccinylase
MSHLDVVPEGDRSMWKTDPYKVAHKDGRIFGRGVEDNQQGSSAPCRRPGLLGNKLVPTHTVKLLFVADEEFGSKFGIQYLLSKHELFRKDDLIIIPDGGCVDGSDIEIAERTSAGSRCPQGQACHGSTPDEGANAFLAATTWPSASTRWKRPCSRPGIPFSIPTVPPSRRPLRKPTYPTSTQYPGRRFLCFDMRILPRYSVAQVLAEVEKIMREVEKTHGVKISYEILQRNESKATPRRPRRRNSREGRPRSLRVKARRSG